MAKNVVEPAEYTLHLCALRPALRPAPCAPRAALGRRAIAIAMHDFFFAGLQSRESAVIPPSKARPAR